MTNRTEALMGPQWAAWLIVAVPLVRSHSVAAAA